MKMTYVLLQGLDPKPKTSYPGEGLRWGWSGGKGEWKMGSGPGTWVEEYSGHHCSLMFEIRLTGNGT